MRKGGRNRARHTPLKFRHAFVGSFSLLGGVALLGGISLSGASHCRELLIVGSRRIVRRHLTVRSFSRLGDSHCLEAFHSRYFCHTSCQCQNRWEPLIVVRFALSGVSYGRDGQEVSLSRASRHRELLVVGRFQIYYNISIPSICRTEISDVTWPKNRLH